MRKRWIVLTMGALVLSSTLTHAAEKKKDRDKDADKADRADAPPAETPPTSRPADSAKESRDNSDPPTGGKGKTGRQTQGEQAADTIKRQKRIVEELASESTQKEPAASTDSIADLRSQLDAENTRWTGRLATLQQDAQAADEGKKKDRAKMLRKTIDKESAEHDKVVAGLQKKIDAVDPKPAASR